MKTVPSYPKIMSFGGSLVGHALDGEVVVQEKVDGSQFGFGINEDGELVFRSKGQANLTAPDGLFAAAVRHITEQYARWTDTEKMRDCYFYGEVVSRPKHNVLCYDRCPSGNVVLFDGIEGGSWLTRAELEVAADILAVDVVPERFRGEATPEVIRELLATPSFLGGVIQEGVVVKNYGQSITINGFPQPLFVKLVRAEFKEAHSKEWGEPKVGKSAAEEVAAAFCTEARWLKAAQHLREDGRLLNEPRDIPTLMGEVQRDLVEECEADIKDALWRIFRKDILRAATRRLPEWWKGRLVEVGE